MPSQSYLPQMQALYVPLLQMIAGAAQFWQWNPRHKLAASIQRWVKPSLVLSTYNVPLD